MYRTEERVELESGHQSLQLVVEYVGAAVSCPSPVKYKDRESAPMDGNDVAKNEGNAKAGVTPQKLIDLSLLEPMTCRNQHRSTSCSMP